MESEEGELMPKGNFSLIRSHGKGFLGYGNQWAGKQADVGVFWGRQEVSWNQCAASFLLLNGCRCVFFFFFFFEKESTQVSAHTTHTSIMGVEGAEEGVKESQATILGLYPKTLGSRPELKSRGECPND